ncbi:hypothetical protein H5410_006382 [Solanum commersonii]|uniref:Uncharacterized protein n=1 Tax=Solanum commersonii TaxID=4109 RepID=A0A9J6AA41_SOLCO|nr:hypothetical protein H5410_006382 [Solanum commersonii]
MEPNKKISEWLVKVTSGTLFGTGVTLVATRLGADIGIIGTGLGAIGSGLSNSGKLMRKKLTIDIPIVQRRVVSAEAIQSWEEAGMRSKSRERWRIVPASIWWAIWKERNSRFFDSIENSLAKSQA